MATETVTIGRRLGWEYLGEIKFEIEVDPTAPHRIKLGLAVMAAVKSRADLSWANLSGADLPGANLPGANLSRADLPGANLPGANLSRANLSGADLSGADLSGANLSGANLSGADLSGANLSGANLPGANLSRANLSGADLSGADLSGANLSGANLPGANLSGANLSGANLPGANLSRANLSGANLPGADLSGANLSGADLSEEAFRPFKADLWATILSLRAIPLEMKHLIAKLRAGEVDGGTYGSPSVKCACLVGTLAQPRQIDGEALDHNSSRPAERWFMMIKPGDAPGAKVDGKETGGGFAARKALEWTLELATILGIDPDSVPEPAVLDGEVA